MENFCKSQNSQICMFCAFFSTVDGCLVSISIVLSKINRIFQNKRKNKFMNYFQTFIQVYLQIERRTERKRRKKKSTIHSNIQKLWHFIFVTNWKQRRNRETKNVNFSRLPFSLFQKKNKTVSHSSMYQVFIVLLFFISSFDLTVFHFPFSFYTFSFCVCVCRSTLCHCRCYSPSYHCPLWSLLYILECQWMISIFLPCSPLFKSFVVIHFNGAPFYCVSRQFDNFVLFFFFGSISLLTEMNGESFERQKKALFVLSKHIFSFFSY